MGEPSYYRGILDYKRGEEVEVIEFYYPAGVSWSCNNCGDCCGDLDNRTRMILLLPDDILRIKDTGATDFYEVRNEGSFTGLMCKMKGKCTFFTGNGCIIYENRALLCRMYPFWLEKRDEYFLFGIDHKCSGSGKGTLIEESFFEGLLTMALMALDY